MESQGLVESTWGVSENHRRVRVYKLTPRGRKQALGIILQHDDAIGPVEGARRRRALRQVAVQVGAGEHNGEAAAIGGAVEAHDGIGAAASEICQKIRSALKAFGNG